MTVPEALSKVTNVTSNMIWVLSLVVTIALFSVIVLFMYHEVPEKNHDIVLILVTALTTGWVGIMSYHFGTSAGSEAKNKTIEKLAE